MGGSWARTLLPAAVSSSTYDAANQQTAFNGQTQTFDLNGNLLTDGTNSYTWNARNQLGAISGPVSASFVYDALGRRQQKMIAGTATDIVYDGLNPVRQSTDIVTVDLLTSLGIDGHLTRTMGSTVEYLLSDALGSTIALVDGSGSVTTEYSYDSFGADTATGTSSSNGTKYTGREDDGTGLRYYRARYYDPDLQRFISEDPIGFAGGDANLYLYVDNNPITATDPLGLLKFSSFGSFQLKGVATPTVLCCGGQGSVGYRVGSTQASPSAVKFQGYANGQLLRGVGLSGGRGVQFGFAFSNVEDLPQLREVSLDSPLLGISLLVREGGIPVGAALGGPSWGASLTASHPDWPGKDWTFFDYGFDWRDVMNSIWGPPGVGNAVRLSGRK